MSSSDIDYSKPLATLLREGTQKAHDVVAFSPGAKRLTSGLLSKDEYVRYLMSLWHVYDAFERALERHATHPTLETTYNPTLLARAAALSADISYLLQVDNWKSHTIHKQLLASTPQSLKDYVGRINELSNSSDPSALLAHSYVRYLGDLSGGQSIRHTLAKAYDLDEASGLGLSFYAFKELRSSKLASQGEMKRIKEWFREGMNAAGKTDQVKASVVDEAALAFELNSALLTILDTEPPTKDTQDTKEIVFDPPSTESTYSLSSVAAVIAAVCLAHFIIVVGGFSGNRGYEKLQAVEQWIRNYFQPMSE
ncbi:hypothetical protein CVT24_004503 [Panaeolus cyanescens]|uniref:Uncharacterized protein n=1 Tax=Panaeolus cyanescens TaxID=181874 RepID=A0A409YBR2_9AGAR|nr:hypothetical protein CVT24_004503 [Panaeolus cyanescens]